jgi:polar amino acid transport system substrate-binding protein
MPDRWYYIAGIVLILCLGSIVLMTWIIPPQPDPSPAPQTDKLAEILARGKIVIASQTNYPPWSDRKPGAIRTANTKCAPNEFTAGELTGFDVDVAVEVARRLGVEPCFVTPPRTQVFSGSWADAWDIGLGSITITTERAKVLYFAQPYKTVPSVFYVSRHNTAFSNISDLSGKRIGVCAGCIQERYLQGSLEIPGEKIEYVVKNASIVAYNSDPLAFPHLVNGELDAVLVNMGSGQAAVNTGTPIKLLDGPVFYNYVAAAIDKKSARDPVPFTKKVTEIIQEMHRDSTLQKLIQPYYEQDLTIKASKFNITALGQFPP